TRYRSDDQLAAWSPRDPIVCYEAWLRAEGHLDDARAGAIRAEADAVAQTMRTKLVNAPVPPPSEVLFDRVYTSPSRTFQAERDEFAATLEPSE
ncbi:MAG TPA: pyruvate dehydrogenase (acetyl-transferring) E1 component subunit alpha, partial [Candidatus Dormibacteraeota bacterium]|nr:pyruvate dehydrogenase (acetyl-transferring) E1 component subunit alpha [Candidatus Dormibacteraeota bacterium]